MLLAQYTSAFSHPLSDYEVNSPPQFFIKETEGRHLDDILITEQDVIEALKSFSMGAALGPDGVPASLLKYCAEEIAKPLTHIFQMSLESGEVPDSLKLAEIIPIHKGRVGSLPENF